MIFKSKKSSTEVIFVSRNKKEFLRSFFFDSRIKLQHFFTEKSSGIQNFLIRGTNGSSKVLEFDSKVVPFDLKYSGLFRNTPF